MRLIPQASRLFSSMGPPSMAALMLCGHLAFAQDLGRAPALERPPADLARMTQQSAVIVHGAVSGREVKWVGRVLYTFYNLSVWETLQGRPQSSVVVAVPGGSLGNVELAVPQAPTISDGDEIVVFGKSLEDQAALTPLGHFDGLITTREGPGKVKFALSGSGTPERLDEFLNRVRSLSRR